MFAKKSGEFSKGNSRYKMPRTAFYTSYASASDRLSGGLAVQPFQSGVGFYLMNICSREEANKPSALVESFAFLCYNSLHETEGFGF